MRDPLYTLLAEHIASLTSADDVRWLLDQLLTDAEIRRFEELSLEGPDTGLWLSIQESSQPPTTSTSFRPQHEIDTQLAVLLGPEGYSEYHSFTRTVPARSFAAAPGSSTRAAPVILRFVETKGVRSSRGRVSWRSGFHSPPAFARAAFRSRPGPDRKESP